MRQGTHKVNWCGTHPAGKSPHTPPSPPHPSLLGNTQPVNRLPFILAELGTKRAAYRAPGFFHPGGTGMASLSSELMFLPLGGTQITSNTPGRQSGHRGEAFSCKHSHFVNKNATKWRLILTVFDFRHSSI